MFSYHLKLDFSNVAATHYHVKKLYIVIVQKKISKCIDGQNKTKKHKHINIFSCNFAFVHIYMTLTHNL